MFVEAKNRDLNSGPTSSSKSTNPLSFIDPATYMSNGEFVFRVPPEAPVFEPSVEEFLDPLAYINKIRPLAEKTGICKVKPPPEWHPPFAVDVDHFKFTPRIQKLNELDANTRVKLYFLDRLATYWNYSGVQIRIPAIEDKTVDMYSLYRIVELEGGFDKINMEKKWSKVALRMGYTNDKNVGPQLRTYYKRLLLPYEKFERSKLKNGPEQEESKPNLATASSSPGTAARKDSAETVKVKTEPGVQEMGSKNCGSSRRCTRSNCDENGTEILVSDTFKNPTMQDKNKELQRLTFYGPGPKILGSNKKQNSPSKKKSDPNQPEDLLADSACMVCGNGESEECILLCDGCDDGYHTFCLVPPLTAVPKGEWRCPKCIAAVVSKATDTTFGFEQAEREYSLQQFGEMADQFKSNYFNMPVHLVPTEKVEQEYWKILASMDSSVTVEYGADLHSMDHGSGFPTQLALKNSGDENHYYKSYVESSWNLNNIPVLEGSVLGYINADISGMKIPWMYVGMCFSTFCWHNEDHWSYSINYLHWGEPKTWYGVPGSQAEQFEKVMQETTPDLFRNQPDLLHQLVTILNPNILMDRGVPVYHIDQAAGEFVLTFPRAYHAGFNHGYNFAEAVNFAPVDWIPLGRDCVEHYSSLHRYCVFSHDELICKMASVPENLNSKLALATHQDMLKMLDVENKQRKALLEWGVVNAEREAFELLADDERQCAECNTTCFLSAVTCKCSPKRVTCLRHFRDHCGCTAIDHTLRYRYTLDELPVMLEKLKEKAESVASWAAKVHDALDVNTPRYISLTGLKELLSEAREKHFPDDLSLNLLSKAIKSVQDALAVDFKNILSRKQTLNKKVTLTEIRSYYEELQRIPCVLPQENTVRHFLKFLDELQIDTDKILRKENATVSEVENLLKRGNFPNVEIPSIDTLKNHKKVLYLIEEFKEKKKNPSLLTPDVINQLIACSASIPNAEDNDRVVSVKKDLLLTKEKVDAWEKKAASCLTSIVTNKQLTYGNKLPLNKLEKLLDEANAVDAFLPSKEKLQSTIKKVYVWKERVDGLFGPKKAAPFLEVIENLFEEAQSMNVQLDDMFKLEEVLNKALSWKNEVYKMFLGDTKLFNLLEVLMPRRNLQRICKYKKNDKPNATEPSPTFGAFDFNIKENFDQEKVVSSFKVAEKREFELMRSLRVKNTYKKKQSESTFCVCNMPSTVYMKECILCKDLFHDQCLKLLANYWEDKKSNYRIFLCPFCQRSKRPSSTIVMNSLIKLQKIQIRTLEGIAMQCLLDRESKWRESVNELLSTPELSVLTKNSTDPISKLAKHNAPVVLSSENKNSLESLLFRGFLLELDLPENEIIFMILHKLDANADTTNQNANSNACKPFSQHASLDKSRVELELTNETSSLKNELTSVAILSKERKRKHITQQENNENDLYSKTFAPPAATKIKKKETTVRKRVRKQNMSPYKRASAAETRQQREIAEKNLSSVICISSPERGDKTDDDVDDEEESECVATKCLKPTGELVEWVQCDYCKNWLHMVCIGVTKIEIDNQTEFMCTLCKNVEKAKNEEDDDDEEDDDVVFVEYAPNSTTLCSS